MYIDAVELIIIVGWDYCFGEHMGFRQDYLLPKLTFGYRKYKCYYSIDISEFFLSK